MKDKVHVKTFKEFLEHNKTEISNDSQKKIDWNLRKSRWLESLDLLYKLIDEIIIHNFELAGYEVTAQKEEIKISEDYIGTYTVYNYLINVGSIKIIFNPIGTIIIGSYGRVNMVLQNETVILVLSDWKEWKIVKGSTNKRRLIDFNEENIVQIFEENI